VKRDEETKRRGCVGDGNTGDGGQMLRRLDVDDLQHEGVAGCLDELHNVLVCRVDNANVANLQRRVAQ